MAYNLLLDSDSMNWNLAIINLISLILIIIAGVIIGGDDKGLVMA